MNFIFFLGLSQKHNLILNLVDFHQILHRRIWCCVNSFQDYRSELHPPCWPPRTAQTLSQNGSYCVFYVSGCSDVCLPACACVTADRVLLTHILQAAAGNSKWRCRRAWTAQTWDKHKRTRLVGGGRGFCCSETCPVSVPHKHMRALCSAPPPHIHPNKHTAKVSDSIHVLIQSYYFQSTF